MAIPASELVRVQPRVLAGTGQDLAFNGLFLTANAVAPVATLLTFRDTAGVGEYFGTSSDEYKAAQVYFNGYNNSVIKPSTLFFWRTHAQAAAPYVRSQTLSASAVRGLLASFTAISAGNFSTTIGKTAVNVADLDLTKATSISDVCSKLSAAIQAFGKTTIESVESTTDAAVASAQVTWDSVLRTFTLTAGTASAATSIGTVSGGLADLMHLSADYKPVTSVGADAQAVADALNEVSEQTQNFVTFSTVAEAEKADALALAGWANAQYNASNGFLYVYWSQDEKLKTSDGTETVTALKEAGYIGTVGIYGDVRYAAFVMGAAASIDWDRYQGTITFAYKRQSGLEANVANKAEAANLTANGVNFMGDYASRNDSFILLQPGQMFGAWKWIDAYLNSIWLNNALQVQILSGMEMAGRVPYNDSGYTRIRAWCRDVIDRALNNGVIDRGVNISETQINELINEAGEDISTELYNNGYVLQIIDADATIRQNRTSPAMNLWYTYAGSVHKINLPSTAVV